MVFHSRKDKHRINEIHEVLERDKPFTIHERNLQKLAIEMFKVNNELSVQLVIENFHFAENHYNLKTLQLWQVSIIRSNVGNLSLQVAFAKSTYKI